MIGPDSWRPTVERRSDALSRWWRATRRRNGGVWVALMAIQFAVYSYFFTLPILTDHTFPNMWVQPFPSHRTRDEGRWFQDVIMLAQGGSGVPSLQVFAAPALQAGDGVLFARLLGIERAFGAFRVAAIVCLQPAILDTYCFASDHLSFAFGDTLALVGTLCVARSRPNPLSAFVAGLCLMLSLATYGPKIAFVGLLCVCHLATSLARSPADAADTSGQTGDFRVVATRIGYVVAVFAAACLCFFASVKLCLATDTGMRVQLNSANQMVQAAVAAYPRFLALCTVESDYLPVALRALPAVAVAMGCVALVLDAWRAGPAAAWLVTLLVATVPVVVRAAYILNPNSFEYQGRLTSVTGYAIAFFLAAALHRPRLKWFATVLLLMLAYFMAVVASQETNAAAMKTIYETNTLNRLAARIEDRVENLYKGTRPLVVIGQIPDMPYGRYVRFENRFATPHVRFTAFPHFRQVPFLNFLFGRDVLRPPTAAEVARAVASARDRKPWPAEESVYVEDGVLVVVLERYRDGVPRTLAVGE